MTARSLFATAFVLGCAVGCLSGWLLPAWLSGGPVWAFVAFAMWRLYRRGLSPVAYLPGLSGALWGGLAAASAVEVSEATGYGPGLGALTAAIIAVSWRVGEWVTPDDDGLPISTWVPGLPLYVLTVTLAAAPWLMEVLL